MRLTPEEWVRQQLLHRLVAEFGYPAYLIAVEVAFRLPSLQGKDGGKLIRCDAVVYGNIPLPAEEGRGGASPLMIIECKAETVPLTQKTLDQAVTYNRKLNVPHLLLCNGIQAIYVNGKNNTSSGLPRYTDLLRCE